jgi:REP element-mobilizing transposase RayT
MTLFRNEYRIESARLRGWNYASTGCYFLTICTHQKLCSLGYISNGNIGLSTLGRLVEVELLRSFLIRAELTCYQYVIMPNHLHLIVGLSYSNSSKSPMKQGTSPLNPKSVSSFVGGFKSSVTTKINSMQNTAGEKIWQPLFYDHLIRNNIEFENISNYITNNPRNWPNDRFYASGANPGDTAPAK